ncbi:MAG: CoA transferase [Robiginitomaculum sp.]|nr:MAG: CoA transferase [Robiginitomaculum sp.]
MTQPQGALHGVRILDLSRVLAGPWATQTLADLGAEVIKVERPGVGDDTRAWGPPFYDDKDGRPSDSAYFMVANRNKASLCVDFSADEGRKILLDLIPKCDVLVENFKTGHLARYGLDYKSAIALNPALVYCSITGFGQTGPMQTRAGYDYLVQAMSGLMSVTGEADGPPTKVGLAISDLVSGLYASNAIIAALFSARQTGKGQHIDISLLDCQMAVMTNQAANTLLTGEDAYRMGTRHPSLAPYQVYQAADAPVVIAVANDGQFERLCDAIGLQGLHHDARFTTNAARIENREALDDLISPLILARPIICWIEALAAVGVPCSALNTVKQALGEPQVIARGMIDTMMRDDLKKEVSVMASPLRLSETPVSAPKAPPQLGADTDEVLKTLLNFDDLKIARLRKGGII